MSSASQYSPFLKSGVKVTFKSGLEALQYPNLTANPVGLGAGDEGLMWYRSDLNSFFVWDGAAAVAVGGGGGSLQSSYDAGNNILSLDAAVAIRRAGLAYGDTKIASMVVDVVGSPSPFNIGIAGVVPIGLPSLAFGVLYNIVADTTVSFPSATQMEFGIDLVVAGAIFGGAVGTVVMLKNSDVPGDESIYSITALSNGFTTNSVATLFNFGTFAPATFTSTTGTATASIPGVDIGPGAGNGLTSYGFLAKNPAGGDLYSALNDGGIIDGAFYMNNNAGTMTHGYGVLNAIGATAQDLFYGTNGGSVTSSMGWLYNTGTVGAHLLNLENTVAGVVTGNMLNILNQDPVNTQAGMRIDMTATNAADINLQPHGGIPTHVSGDIWNDNNTNHLKFNNNSGALQTIAQWGDSYFFYDAIVDTFATSSYTYAKISDAVAAGKRRILVTQDVNEDTNIAFPTDTTTLIHVNEGVIVLFADAVQWTTHASGTSNIIMEGEGEFRYENTAGGALIVQSQIDNAVTLRGGLTVTNNSTASNTWVVSTGTIYVDGLTLNVPNTYSNTGIRADSNIGNRKCKISNLDLRGGGAAAGLALNIASGTISDVSLHGTWDSTVTNIFIGAAAVANNIVQYAQAITLELAGGIASNLRSTQDYFNVNITSHYSQLNNCYLSSGHLSLGAYAYLQIDDIICDDITTFTCTDSFVNNIRLIDTTLITVAGANNVISGLSTGGDLTVSGAHNDVSACKIAGDTIVSGDFNGVVGGKFGVGGTGTITVNASADKTVITGVKTDTAIVDNGTNTGLSNNVIF